MKTGDVVVFVFAHRRPDVLELETFELGELLMLAGDHEAATAKFRQVIELDPDQAAAHFALAEVLLQTKRPELALESLAVGADLEPDFAMLNLKFGEAYLAYKGRVRRWL